MASAATKVGTLASPRRVETYDTTVTTAGTATVAGGGKLTFSPAFANIPTVVPWPIWVNGQMVVADAVNVTKTGCDLVVMQSQGVVLGGNPFRGAPAGTAVRMLAIG
jgi:hypothetical protein